jgi:predicted nucleic acid-binding protein
MDILADSGVLIRLYERTDPLHPMIRAAVRAIRIRGDRLVSATQNVAEFWNVCTRPKTARGGLGLSVAVTERRLQDLERGFIILTEPGGAYTEWRRLVTSLQVLGKQVHDARLAALMNCHGITHILTLNVADFTRYPGITVLDPAAVAWKPGP